MVDDDRGEGDAALLGGGLGHGPGCATVHGRLLLSPPRLSAAPSPRYDRAPVVRRVSPEYFAPDSGTVRGSADVAEPDVPRGA
ncbi:hypothetical protein GCM10010249_41080 [Streptomyces roseolilacinus]|uniref:Uncharacterized protein n=1 Tax=Streptomyces roseolilacinus TaxID=66904 RepID=A0A918B5W0_9ACTN|nr:hypothetical protein GCM10010249_41080 [Streptomyces roseolilacinus]